MAEAFLQVLLDNLSSIIQGELGFFFGFKEEFEKLSSTFTTIQAVLEDAQEKQLKDKAIKNWLQKLNVGAYEVDDILDECKTKAARFKKTVLGHHHPQIITFRYKVVKKMKEMMEKLDAIAEERRMFHLREIIAERRIATRETGFLLTEPEVYGRYKEEDELVKILINDAQELSVLPIIGMGGLGKTTLAQMVFNDQRVIEHFNLKIWVCVSEDFDEKRLIKAIIESIEGRPIGDLKLAPFQKKLQELLKGKRYFLVLDDVWNENQEKWANLKAVLKVGASGASVLITTRLEKVGSIMGTLQPFQLTNLSQEDCWMLFMQRAFGHHEEINPKLVAIGKKIVKKCGGVPLAAKTLGGLLRFKREESEWKHVKDSEIWNLPEEENSILPVLRLSYHHLPIDLRQCFVYCAVFPKDTKMKKEELISLWMAHDFLLSRENLELKDVGNEVWNELYLRSFFQEIEVKSDKTYFRMHDLIHDLATSLFSASMSSSNIREINVRHYNDMMSNRCYNDMMSVGFAEAVSPYSPPLLLKKFLSLRVLNLSNSRYKRLSSSIGDLVHLRYLNLSDTDIPNLPKRLCKLQNLQTLALNNCNQLSCLPKQTSKISSLRNLLLDNCPLTSIPPRIGSLTYLKTLGRFVVGSKKGYQLGELRNINLCGSISITHLERVKNDMDAKEANLSEEENSILPALRLSYHHLPLDLRQCFAYCAVFPKDTKMEKEKLSSLWMAHGFLLSRGNLELWDVGNEVWKELYLRSFFQVVEEDTSAGKTHFKMHDLIHDLATSLFSASTPSSNIREMNVEEDYENMMSIGFAKVVSSYSPLLLTKFVSLRVLNLSDSNIKQLSSSIRDLVHLRYLDLSDNMDIRSLPKRLCKLQNLPTLNISDCESFSCLPKQTSKLCSLRNLLLDDCPLTSMPPRMGSLTCLKTLGFFIVGERKGYQLGELRNLNLHGSISITHLERVKNYKEAEEANLSAKANLHSLSMDWDRWGPHRYESEEVKLLEALKPHPNLKSLRITSFRGSRFPDWIKHLVLGKVVTIEIRDCKNCSCLPPCGELHCLESVELHEGSEVVEYVEEDDVHSGFPTRRRFPSLRKLDIRFFDDLKGLLKKEGGEQFQHA